MTCLKVEQLYAYLEGELAGRDKTALEDHLAACEKCRDALETRKDLLAAAETLPPFDVPPDFAQSIMDRLSPAAAKSKIPLPGRLAAAAVGLATFGITISVVSLISRRSLSQLFLGLNRFFWNAVQGFATTLAKLAKYIVLTFKILGQIAGAILEIFKALTSVIGPETQIIFLCVTMILVIACGYLWSRRFATERNHEK
jgi:predicted anti-sigma-YlaC factor YlaD